MESTGIEIECVNKRSVLTCLFKETDKVSQTRFEYAVLITFGLII